MAKYWVNGGSGTWNDSSNWSATSGGTSGESPPTINDDVYFDSSGTGTCTVEQEITLVNSLTMTDATINFNHGTFAVTNDFQVSENALILNSGLENANLSIGRDATIIGKPSPYMNLVVSVPWTITVYGLASATQVNVANSNAGHGSTVDASFSGDGMFNINWNFIPNIPPSSINYFKEIPSRNGRDVVSKIVPDMILDRADAAGGGTYFDSTAKIARVDIIFWDSNLRESKRVIHVGTNLEGFISWSPTALSGVWSALQARLVDNDGAELFIGRDILGDYQDINLL